MRSIKLLSLIISTAVTFQSQATDWSGVQAALHGVIDGGAQDGATMIEVLPSSKTLLLRLPNDHRASLPAFGKTKIRELHGLSVEFKRAGADRGEFLVEIPLKAIVNGARLPSYGKLPNGNFPPYLPPASLRGLAFKLPRGNGDLLHVYFGPDAVAAFVELPQVSEISYLPRSLGFPVKNATKTEVRGFYGVYNRKGEDTAGIYGAVRIPSDVVIEINRLLAAP